MRRRRLLTAAAAALTAGLSGCSSLGLGGGDGGDGTTTAPTTTTIESTRTQTEDGTSEGTTDSPTTTQSDLPDAAVLLPEGSVFGSDWQRMDITGRNGGAVGSYERETDKERWEMELLVREFDDEETAADNLAEERDRLGSYTGVEIVDIDVGDEAFGVSRTSKTATLWYRSGTVVSSIDMETDYRVRGGGPDISVSDLGSFAEAAIGAWG
jgi:hypothetical protein